MKTPIQKLIEELEELRRQSAGQFTEVKITEVKIYTKAIKVANYFLEEEQDALDEAYSQGVIDEHNEKNI